MPSAMPTSPPHIVSTVNGTPVATFTLNNPIKMGLRTYGIPPTLFLNGYGGRVVMTAVPSPLVRDTREVAVDRQWLGSDRSAGQLILPRRANKDDPALWRDRWFADPERNRRLPRKQDFDATEAVRAQSERSEHCAKFDRAIVFGGCGCCSTSLSGYLRSLLFGFCIRCQGRPGERRRRSRRDCGRR